MNGIIPLYKPRGMTSFDCIRKLRRLLHIKKMGHSGTLDPDVDGVLVICVGGATKVTGHLMTLGKVYQGTVTLGEATSTEDLSGKIIRRQRLNQPVASELIQQQMRQLVSSRLVQIPPMYSAIRVHGHHLYEYARKGISVRRPRHVVSVNDFRLIRPSRFLSRRHQQVLYFEVSCGKGTYVRTLATDLGRLLKVPAVMSDLTRVKSGGFDIHQTLTFQQLRSGFKRHRLNQLIRPISDAYPTIPIHNLTTEQWQRVQNGAFLYLDDFKKPSRLTNVLLNFRHSTKALYGYDRHRHCYRPVKMFSTK